MKLHTEGNKTCTLGQHALKLFLITAKLYLNVKATAASEAFRVGSPLSTCSVGSALAGSALLITYTVYDSHQLYFLTLQKAQAALGEPHHDEMVVKGCPTAEQKRHLPRWSYMASICIGRPLALVSHQGSHSACSR
jgi:hypothetical protein